MVVHRPGVGLFFESGSTVTGVLCLCSNWDTRVLRLFLLHASGYGKSKRAPGTGSRGMSIEGFGVIESERVHEHWHGV